MDDQQVDQILGGAEQLLREISQSPVPTVNPESTPDIGPLVQQEVQKALVPLVQNMQFMQGPPGRDGRDGVDGLDGSPGKSGRDGKDGREGKDGKPGRKEVQIRVPENRASAVDFTAHGNLTSTNVQDALAEEVDDLAASSGSSLVGFAQSGIGAVTSETVQTALRRVMYAEQLGASSAAAAATNTTAIQAALDEVGNSRSGGTVYIITPGTYLLAAQGSHPYAASRKYVLDLKYDNVGLVIGPGVVLKLADSQQTDAGGAVDMIVFRDRTNLYIGNSGKGGRGRITGNTAGQSGWTGGYTQTTSGQIIAGFATTTNGNFDILIEGLQTDDHFSNPVNIANHETGRGARNMLRDLYGFSCGEGFQIQLCDGAYIIDCTFEDGDDVCEGDAFEMARCHYFVCRGCVVKSNGAGSAFDLVGSKYGVVNDFVVDGWANGFGASTATDTAEYITVGPGVFKGCTTNVLSAGDGHTVFKGVHVVGGASTPFQVSGDSSLPPVVFDSCVFHDNASPADVRETRGAIIKGCIFSASAGHGLRVFATASSQTPLIVIEGNKFLNNTGTGLLIDANSQTGFAPVGSISGNAFGGNGTAWNFIATVTMTNLYVQMQTQQTALGTAAAPGYSFFGDLDTGFYWAAGNAFDLSLAGQARIRWQSAPAMEMQSTMTLAWSSSTIGSSTDVKLTRLSNGQMGVANSTGAAMNVKTVTALLSAVSGASVTSSSLIPDGAFVVGVSTRITTSLGTSNGTTGYQVGDGVDADRWGDKTGTTAGTTTTNADATANFSGAFTAADDIVITAKVGNFDGTGAIRIAVHYFDSTAPTS